jgi:hypothetical protein
MAKVAIALTLALIFASLQCVTLCAAPARPACPHHQKSVDSCSHELVYLQVPAIVPAPSIQATLVAMLFADESSEPAITSVIRSAPPPLRL